MRLLVVVSILVCMAMVQYVRSTSELEDEIIVDAKPVPIVGKSEPVTPPIDFTTKETVQELSMEGEGIPPPPVFSEAEIKTWPMKQLKQFLSARGLSCKGCSEKEDFVKLAVANQHVPLVEAANAEAPPPVPPPAADAEEIEQLMAKLKRGGFGNSKFFSANDFDGLSPEEMAEKINGKPGKGKRKSNKGKSNKAQSEGNSESQGTGSSSSTTEKDKSSKKSKKSSKKSDKKTTSNKKTTEPSPKRTRIVDTPVEEETIEL